MNLFRSMKVFERVATLHSMSAAARDLSMSVSAVGRAVEELENDLGVRLLNRTTRTSSLTESGALYLSRIQPLLADVQSAQEEIRDLHKIPRGRLRVGGGNSFSQSCIVPLVPEFLKLYPDVNLELTLSPTPVHPVSDGFDIAIHIGALSDSALVGKHLGFVHMQLCASPTYIEQFGLPESPSDLSEHACVVDTTGKHQVHWRVGEDSIPITPKFAVNSYSAVHDAVLAGLGIGMLANFSANSDLVNGDLVRLFPEHALHRDPVYALYPHKRHLPAKVRVFLSFIADRLAHRLNPDETWRNLEKLES